jgi:hypothetical protein
MLLDASSVKSFCINKSSSKSLGGSGVVKSLDIGRAENKKFQKNILVCDRQLYANVL